MRILQPQAWPRSKGYANGVEAFGRTIFVAGQVGWNERQEFVQKNFCGQFEQALHNTLVVLREANAGPEHVVRLNWFITDKHAYLNNISQVGQIYRGLMGRHYPAMTVLQVSALIEDEALIEIEATAVIP